MSYPFLIGEMAKRRITREALSKSLGLHRNAISYKLREGSFSIEEAAKVKEEFFLTFQLQHFLLRKKKRTFVRMTKLYHCRTYVSMGLWGKEGDKT